jgi:uncharacterized protein YdgA (DUF945 family)
MNRKVIAAAAAVVLLGAAIVGGAMVTGTQAKKQLQSAPLAWQSQWPMLKVLDQHYDRSVFSGTHTVSLQLGCEGGAATGGSAPVVVTLVQHVKHGPLPGFSGVGAAVIDTELVLPEAARKVMAELTGDQPPIKAHTEVALSGASHTQVTMPAFRMSGPNGQQIAWQGLTGDVRDSGSSLQYDVSVPGFTMSTRDEKVAVQIRMAGLRARGQMNGGGMLWVRGGKGEGELASLEMSFEGQNGSPVPPLKLAFSQLRFAAENALDKDLLSNTGHFSGQGMVNDVKLDKIELQASIKRLHAPSYERLMQHVMDTSAAACGMKQAVSPQVMLAQVQQDLAALLPFNPEYAIDQFAVETGGKRGEMSYAFGIAGATEADAQLPLPTLLMTRAQLRGHARVPVEWVEKTAARLGASGAADPAAQAEMVNVMLTKMTSDGFVLREGEMLSTQFSLEHGQMLVNGKPVGRPAAPGQ